MSMSQLLQNKLQTFVTSRILSNTLGESGSLKRALIQHRRVLAVLEEQAAGYGSLAVPPHLIVQIQDESKKIAEIKTRLEELTPQLPEKGQNRSSWQVVMIVGLVLLAAISGGGPGPTSTAKGAETMDRIGLTNKASLFANHQGPFTLEEFVKLVEAYGFTKETNKVSAKVDGFQRRRHEPDLQRADNSSVEVIVTTKFDVPQTKEVELFLNNILPLVTR